MTATIDLGDLGGGEPWAPPETPRPRRRLSGPPRWVAAVAVAAVAAGLPVTSAAAAGPVLHLASGALTTALGGGRIYVTRFGGEGPHRLEVYGEGGARLWGTDLSDSQLLMFADDDAALVSVRLPDNPALATVTALDPRTGAQLWQRAGVSVAGRLPGRTMLVDTSRRVTLPAGADPQAQPREANQLVTVDSRTGAPVWSLAVPVNAVVAFGRGGNTPFDLTSFSVLDPDGTLRGYDLATGAVARTDRLEPGLSGLGSLLTGEDGDAGPPGARAGQVRISTDRGDDVYDRASGRMLWHAAPGPPVLGTFVNLGNTGQAAIGQWPLSGCAPGLWCRLDGAGLVAYEARTGRQAWRVDGFTTVLGAGAETVALGALGDNGQSLAAGVIVDARTGAIRSRIDGWHPVVAEGHRIVVWRRPDGERVTTLGLLDPGTGRITVFGTGDSWGGMPSCSVDARVVACGVAGELTVWPLPAAARR
ncbi:PQQ-binding-like beta-propeller repeat protein [Dactylosporangium sp. NPDC049140]|uniref:outer membrane protein assembly factor BamB family protein n=1 Tax=Dactylosporangium sp. NPDC049140 TaxID=3155647 RepID=UPI0033EA9314